MRPLPSAKVSSEHSNSFSPHYLLQYFWIIVLFSLSLLADYSPTVNGTQTSAEVRPSNFVIILKYCIRQEQLIGKYYFYVYFGILEYNLIEH